MKKVTIITPAVGQAELSQCIRSVAAQSYEDVEHWVVVDGGERYEDVLRRVDESGCSPSVIKIPHVTGRRQYFGARIYAAMPFVCESDWIMYLDEDNWIERCHVARMVELVEQNDLQWAYALRNVVRNNGEFLCRDDCQSLGWWPAFGGGYHLVDTSCYVLSRTVAAKCSHFWYRPSYDPLLETPDRAFCMHLMANFPRAVPSGEYTVNYRLGGHRCDAADRRYFQQGNDYMRQLYVRFPWLTTRVAGKNPRHPSLDWTVAASPEDASTGMPLAVNAKRT